MILTTNAGYEIHQTWDRDHGRPKDLVELNYREHCVYLALRELEDYESETNCRLPADVLTLEEWRSLLRWLKENVSLYDVTGNRGITRVSTLIPRSDFQI